MESYFSSFPLYRLVIFSNDLNTDSWITANAGSGKTTRLVDRFLFLLRNGVKADEIFCITYTRAGAKEMIDRIINIAYQNGIIVKKEQLKVSTIHSLCKDFLEQCDEISKDVKIFDGDKRIQQQIVNEIIDNIHCVNSDAFKSNISKVLDRLSAVESVSTFKELINSILAKQNAFLSLFLTISKKNCKNSTLQTILENTDIERFSELLPHDLRDCVKKRDDVLKRKQNLQSELRVYSNEQLAKFALDVLTQKYFEKLPKSQDWYSVNEWRKIVLTSNAPRKKAKESSIPIIRKLLEYHVDYLKYIAVDASFSVIYFAYVVLLNYQTIKHKMNVITYDDILFQGLQAIKNDVILFNESAENGRYLNIKHLMLDEAQDTNPISWEIIRNIVDKSGCNFFIVGDKKQSIYRFQGARVEEYDRNKTLFADLAKKFGHQFDDRSNLQVSYRSLPSILKCVDRFCNSKTVKHNFCGADEDVVHVCDDSVKTNHTNEYLLPFNESIVYEDIEDFTKTGNDIDARGDMTRDDVCFKSLWLDRLSHEEKKYKNKREKNVHIADEIAKYVIINQNEIDKKIIDKKYNKVAVIYPKNTNGDIYDIVSTLRNKYKLTVCLKPDMEKHSIYYYDLMSFFKFACLQIDNLNLACLLKSDFFCFTDEILQKICCVGKPVSNTNTLWDKLQSAFLTDKCENEKIKYTVSILKKIVACNCVCEVFDLIKILLSGNVELQHKYLEALKLLSFGVDKYKEEYNFDLRGFINEIENCDFTDYNDVDVNAESTGQSCVYVSTIHGVKGMEFDTIIVLNPEVGSSDKERFLFFDNQFWYKSPFGKLQQTDESCKSVLEAIDTNKEQEDNEKYRLFYVAITRARRRLVYIGRSFEKKGENGKTDDFYKQLFL